MQNDERICKAGSNERLMNPGIKQKCKTYDTSSCNYTATGSESKPKCIICKPAGLMTEGAIVIIDREAVIIDREAAIIDREAVIINREAAIIDREAAIINREAVIIDREAAIIDREAAIIDREAAIIDREAAIIDREAVIIDREAVIIDQTGGRQLCRRFGAEKNDNLVIGYSKKEGSPIQHDFISIVNLSLTNHNFSCTNFFKKSLHSEYLFFIFTF